MYAIGLMMDGRYVDIGFHFTDDVELAKWMARKYILPEFSASVATVVLGQIDLDHPAYVEAATLEMTGAFTRIGNDGETAIDEFVRRHFGV